MVRAAIVNNGAVVNIAIADKEFAEAQGWIVSDTAAIGDTWNGSEFVRTAQVLTESDYVTAIQSMLDAKARERNYDGILSACTYATSTFPKFAAEGQACVAWRDAVWSQCYAILGAVQAGQRAQPTIEQVIAEMPALVWP